MEKLYIEIKWNESSKSQRKQNSSFGVEAERVHGLSFQHLESNGVTEQQAVTEIGNLIIKYWGPTVCVHTLGHNVHLFDLAFLRDMCDRYEIPINFGNRHYCSSSLGFGTFGTFNSNDLFENLGFPERKDHNALQDAEQSLAAFRIIRNIFQGTIK